MYGRKLADSWEIAARKAIEEFSEKHNAEIMDTPYSVIPLKDETTQAYSDRVNRNMNYMMPDYNVSTALSFNYSQPWLTCMSSFARKIRYAGARLERLTSMSST